MEYLYTLWLWLTVRHGFSMALIEIDGLPFLIAWLNNQMVSIYYNSITIGEYQ